MTNGIKLNELQRNKYKDLWNKLRKDKVQGIKWNNCLYMFINAEMLFN